jgi:hypothetical protein
LYLVNYTHATVFVNVNATRGNISLSKYTHGLYFSVQISHYAFGFFFAELALGIIFLAISSIFTCCETGWLIPSPTKKSTADITHPHTTHNHTTKNVTPGSLAATWQQRAALQRRAAWGRQQQHGNMAAATAAWLWRAAWQLWQQHGSAVVAAAAWWRWAARQRQWQRGSSAAAAAAVAARRQRRQLGSCGSVVVAAAVAARWRQQQLGNGGSMVAAVVAAWW